MTIHFRKGLGAACGNNRAPRGFRTASGAGVSDPTLVTCKRCLAALERGVLTLDPKTGATVLVKMKRAEG